jgi:uncharacterized membrane protein
MLAESEAEGATAFETRACCYLCHLKEFLVLVTIALVVWDAFEAYTSVARLAGHTLPFMLPGNHSLYLEHARCVACTRSARHRASHCTTPLSVLLLSITFSFLSSSLSSHATKTFPCHVLSPDSAREMLWYAGVVWFLDLGSVVLLALSICTETIDGLVCSRFGYASCLMLWLGHVLWLSVAVALDCFAQVRAERAVRAVRAVRLSLVVCSGWLLVRHPYLLRTHRLLRACPKRVF